MIKLYIYHVWSKGWRMNIKHQPTMLMFKSRILTFAAAFCSVEVICEYNPKHHRGDGSFLKPKQTH